MSADTRLFEADDHAAVYVQSRPDWPKEIIEKSLVFLCEKKSKPHMLAVDVGCGSGQNTRPLAPHFEQVIGVDVSEAQLTAAKSVENPPNVEYRIGRGESIPVADGSVDLITAAEAAHWFNLAAFFREVDRVLKPGGCVAIYAYFLIFPWVEGDEHKNQLLEDAALKFHCFLKPYTSNLALHLENALADIRIPYKESVRDDTLEIKCDTTLASFLNFLRSWSGYQRYRAENPNGTDLISVVQDRLMKILGIVECPSENVRLTTRCPVVLLLGRKPEETTGT